MFSCPKTSRILRPSFPLSAREVPQMLREVPQMLREVPQMLREVPQMLRNLQLQVHLFCNISTCNGRLKTRNSVRVSNVVIIQKYIRTLPTK